MTGAEIGTLLSGLAALFGAMVAGSRYLAKHTDGAAPASAPPDYSILVKAYEEGLDALSDQLRRCHDRVRALEARLNGRADA